MKTEWQTVLTLIRLRLQEQSDQSLHYLPRSACPKSYRNIPNFLDRQVWANNADADQDAHRRAV